MSEHDPVMIVTVSGEEVEARRENTRLYTFIGENAMYDHVFLTMQQEGIAVQGAFIFKTLANECYTTMYNYMSQNDYPASLNALTIPDGDVEAFERFAYGDIESTDSFPDEWTKEGDT